MCAYKKIKKDSEVKKSCLKLGKDTKVTLKIRMLQEEFILAVTYKIKTVMVKKDLIGSRIFRL